MRRNIAICDDEKTIRDQLSLHLNQIQEESGDDYHLFYYSSAEELLANMPANLDVILLDIAMGDMTGMECAKNLRAKGYDVNIIFITGMTEYALEGYDVHAFAFLPKPIVYTELKKRLTDCFSHAQKNQTSILPVESAGGKELLSIDEIIFAEVYQHKTSFILFDRKVTGSLQLSQVEKWLTPHGFFRCHRCYLVNLACIRRIDQDALTMQNGTAIPISKHRRKTFMDAFANFMGGRFA